MATGSGVRPNPVEAAQAAAVSASSPDPDAAVGQLVLQSCGGCHGIDTLSQHRQDAAGWASTVNTMESLGAEVPPQDRDAVIAYLARHFGS